MAKRMVSRSEAKKTNQKPATASQLRKQNEKLKEELKKYEGGCYCYMCGRHLAPSQFYVDTDPRIHNSKKDNGLNAGRVCKTCLTTMAERRDLNGDLHEPTKESVILALKYANKPFIESLWNSSIEESNNLMVNNPKANAYRAYMKNVGMVQFNGLTFQDSDFFKEKIVYDDEKSEKELVEEHAGQDTYDSFVKNKADVTRLLGYDPFEEEKISDQPFLYSQLLGMLDSSSQDSVDDMMKISSCITIVRGFLQQQKLDDAITKLMGDVNAVAENSATIKSLQDSKQKITSMITNLAAESCLSLKNSRVQTKASVTWTGKIAKIRELDLREGQVNGFDVNTCRGFQQVQQISDASIMKQLALDDSEWSDMVADMRDTNQRLRKQKDSYEEINRILLKENLDLKDALQANGVEIKQDFKPLKELYSVFSDEENGIEFQKEEGENTESDNSSV